MYLKIINMQILYLRQSFLFRTLKIIFMLMVKLLKKQTCVTAPNESLL